MVRVVFESGTETLEGRRVRYEITAGFYRWELEYKGKAWDEATGLMGKSKGRKSSSTASREAMEDLRAKLSSAGHFNTPTERPPPPPTVAAAEPISSLYTQGGRLNTPSEHLSPTASSISPVTTAHLSSSPVQLSSEWTMISYAPVATGSLIVLATCLFIVAQLCRKRRSNARECGAERSHLRINQREVETREMMNTLGPEVYPKWEMFATELGIANGVIESISRKGRGEDQQCFLSVLAKWRNSPPIDYPFTLESAVRILRKPMINLKKLAKEIEQELNQAATGSD